MYLRIMNPAFHNKTKPQIGAIKIYQIEYKCKQNNNSTITGTSKSSTQKVFGKKKSLFLRKKKTLPKTCET